MVMRRMIPLLLLAACAEPGEPEGAWSWYEAPASYDVQESVAFTDVPYDFTGPTAIADLPVATELGTVFATDDGPPDCAEWSTTDELPAEIEGIVTLHPRYYYKSQGCLPETNDDGLDSDEKYYGSYFIEDASGGIFVLGDSKVAHFDMGDRVRMRVRAVRDAFGVNTVAAHDITEVLRGPEAISYVEKSERFDAADVSEVRRVSGTVRDEIGNFGEFNIEADDGTNYAIGVDAELARRGAYWAPGTRLQATGPVFLSYGSYTLIVMKLGQIQVLDEPSLE
jgi:hypothetical protein